MVGAEAAETTARAMSLTGGRLDHVVAHSSVRWLSGPAACDELDVAPTTSHTSWDLIHGGQGAERHGDILAMELPSFVSVAAAAVTPRSSSGIAQSSRSLWDALHAKLSDRTATRDTTRDAHSPPRRTRVDRAPASQPPGPVRDVDALHTGSEPRRTRVPRPDSDRRTHTATPHARRCTQPAPRTPLPHPRKASDRYSTKHARRIVATSPPQRDRPTHIRRGLHALPGPRGVGRPAQLGGRQAQHVLAVPYAAEGPPDSHSLTLTLLLWPDEAGARPWVLLPRRILLPTAYSYHADTTRRAPVPPCASSRGSATGVRRGPRARRTCNGRD